MWLDMNDLDKTSEYKPTARGDGVVTVDRDSAIGRLFSQ